MNHPTSTGGDLLEYFMDWFHEVVGSKFDASCIEAEQDNYIYWNHGKRHYIPSTYNMLFHD